MFDFDKVHLTEQMFQGKDKAPVNPVTAQNLKVVQFFSVEVMFPGTLCSFYLPLFTKLGYSGTKKVVIFQNDLFIDTEWFIF